MRNNTLCPRIAQTRRMQGVWRVLRGGPPVFLRSYRAAIGDALDVFEIHVAEAFVILDLETAGPVAF